MNLTLSIKRWKNLFKIDSIDIVDLKEWNPYALAEGLSDNNTMIELSLIEIARLSPLSEEKINKIIRCIKL